jgi:hypothetical protein
MDGVFTLVMTLALVLQHQSAQQCRPDPSHLVLHTPPNARLSSDTAAKKDCHSFD